MSIKQIKSEDILPIDVDFRENGKERMKKGTIAVALRSADVIQDTCATDEERQQAFHTLKNLAPSLTLMGLQDYQTWNHPVIHEMIEEELKKHLKIVKVRT